MKRAYIDPLHPFPVTNYRPSIKHNCKTTKGEKLRQQFPHTAAFEVDSTQYFRQIFQRTEGGNYPRPLPLYKLPHPIRNP